MGFKIWAYLAASMGMIVSVYLLFSKKQYKYGCFIICFSLAVFVGGSINISKISGIENSFNAIEEKLRQTEKQVNNIDLKLAQAISLKQEVTQTVNLVTAVQKEIANIKEAIHQQYAAFRIEKFTKVDLGNTVAVYSDPLNPEKDSVIFFELQDIPEENSVQIARRDGTYAPPDAYSVTSNIVSVRMEGLKPDNFLKDDKESYVVKYIPNNISEKKKNTIKGLQMTFEGDKVNVLYQNK